MPSTYDELKRCLEAEVLVAQATVTSGADLGRKLLIWPGGRSAGDLGSATLNDGVTKEAETFLAEQRNGSVTLDPTAEGGDRVEVFIETYLPPPKLIVIGAVHVAVTLVALAKALGFRTTVIDPRSVFATPERFAHADELKIQWPDEALAEMDLNEGTYLVCLTHDEKLDNPALKRAVESRVRYIGALGSKRTHAKRVASLKELGLNDTQLARIHAPIGLKLGGRRPEEIAVAILAEMVAARHGLA